MFAPWPGNLFPKGICMFCFCVQPLRDPPHTPRIDVHECHRAAVCPDATIPPRRLSHRTSLRRAIRSHEGPISLSVWPQQKWVRACRGRGHREKVNYASFARTSMEDSDQQSVTGKIMRLSSHSQGRRVSLFISAINLREWEGKSGDLQLGLFFLILWDFSATIDIFCFVVFLYIYIPFVQFQ